MDARILQEIKARAERVQLKKYGRAINEIERIDLEVHALGDILALVAEVERLQKLIPDDKLAGQLEGV